MTRHAIRGRAIVPVLILAAVTAVRLFAAGGEEDWASSPEAYFLTAEERAEWKGLDSRDSRLRFQERYWLKRDPSPGSERNEFRELVLARIKTADARFKIQSTPGSRTARGLAFIVLGSPSRVVDSAAPRPPSEGGGRRIGQGVTPVATVEGNETTSQWFYETDRTPQVLQLIERPSLQITIVVEPSRRQDAIQNPGLFHEVQEIIARKSIANPDLVPAATGEVFAAESPAAPRQAMSAAVRSILERAPLAARGPDSFAGVASLFHESGPAECIVWIYAPPPSKNAAFSGLVWSEDGREVASWTETPTASSIFSTQGNGVVLARRLPLGPGAYTVAVALSDPSGNATAASVLPVRLPALGGRFAVSSMILTAGPARLPPGGDRTFAFGSTSLPPRADAVFRASQSVWYFVQVAQPADPARVTLEPRLRRGGEPVGTLTPFPARLEPLGAGRYLAGVELPLSTLGSGDYVLYLLVRNGGGAAAEEELRRAEFRLVP